MCNLYRLDRPGADVARMFDAAVDPGTNFAAEVYPGHPGLVIAEGRATAMTWGFPLALTGAKGQKLKPRPVNNAREDKLTTPFWRDSFVNRRCLIPVTAWAEAEGEKGRMTRTWYALPHGEPFAVAGVWRSSPEWGRVYSMVMSDGCPDMAEVHDRMPVILAPVHWRQWLEGEPEQALPLCCTWGDGLAVERTAEPWFQRSTPPPAQRLI